VGGTTPLGKKRESKNLPPTKWGGEGKKNHLLKAALLFATTTRPERSWERKKRDQFQQGQHQRRTLCSRKKKGEKNSERLFTTLMGAIGWWKTYLHGRNKKKRRGGKKRTPVCPTEVLPSQSLGGGSKGKGGKKVGSQSVEEKEEKAGAGDSEGFIKVIKKGKNPERGKKPGSTKRPRGDTWENRKNPKKVLGRKLSHAAQ